ncbi:hypothetical protein HBA55_02475 [Pseudomaricurvus alkylphenolicus]|nr:hypothetical protein [Pseudomaricurvus alkylphenolicus]
MEYSIIDISACESSVTVGDEVVIVGEDCSPTDLAGASGNIPELFFSALSKSIKKELITA